MKKISRKQRLDDLFESIDQELDNYRAGINELSTKADDTYKAFMSLT